MSGGGTGMPWKPRVTDSQRTTTCSTICEKASVAMAR